MEISGQRSVEFNIEEAKRLGEAGIPPPDATAPSGPEAAAIQRVEKARQDYVDWAVVRTSILGQDLSKLCRSQDINRARQADKEFERKASALLTEKDIFVLACLRRLHDSSDTVASALVLTLADGAPVESWLQDRLDYLKNESAKSTEWKAEGDDAHPLLARLEALRPALAALTPREAIRLAAAESHVAQLAHQWSDSQHHARTRIANVEALVELGATYEDECIAARRVTSSKRAVPRV